MDMEKEKNQRFCFLYLQCCNDELFVVGESGYPVEFVINQPTPQKKMRKFDSQEKG